MRVWDTASAAQIHSRTMHKKPSCVTVQRMKVSSDDGEAKGASSYEDILLVGDKTGELTALPLPDVTSASRFLLGHTGSILTAVASIPPCGTHGLRIATADRDEKVRISQFPDAHDISCFALGHAEHVTALSPLPRAPEVMEGLVGDSKNGDASFMLSGGGDGVLCLWRLPGDAHSAERVSTLAFKGAAGDSSPSLGSGESSTSTGDVPSAPSAAPTISAIASTWIAPSKGTEGDGPVLLAAVSVTYGKKESQTDDTCEASGGDTASIEQQDVPHSVLHIIRVRVDGTTSPAMQVVQTVDVEGCCDSAQFARGGDVLYAYGAQCWRTFVRVNWGNGSDATDCCHPSYYPAVSGTPGALDCALEQELAELRRVAPAPAVGSEQAKCYNGIGHGEFKKNVIVNKSRPLHRPFNKDKPKKRRRKK